MSQITITARATIRWKVVLRSLARVLCLVILFLSAALLIPPFTGQQGRLYDFCQEWTSARNYFTGHPIYMEYARSIEVHLGLQVDTPFKYNAHPPASVLLVLPAGLLDYRLAYLLWAVISMCCLAIALWGILRQRGEQITTGAGLVFLILLVGGNALRHHIVQGQLNLVLLLIIVGAWAADRKGRPGTSGMLIGLAGAIKLFPAFLVVYFVARCRWRSVWAAAASFASVNLAAATLFGLDSFVAYLTEVMPSVSRYRDTWENASVWGFWSRLFDGSYGQVVPLWRAPTIASLLAILSCIAVTAWTVRAVSRVSRRDTSDLAFSLCVIAMLIVSPITWDHYSVLLILPLIIAWQAERESPIARGILATILVLLLTISPYWIWHARGLGSTDVRLVPFPAEPVYVLTIISYPFYALLGFYLLVLKRLRMPDAVSACGVEGSSDCARH